MTLPKIKAVLSVLALVVAGFFLYLATMLAFFVEGIGQLNADALGGKTLSLMLGVPLLLALGAWVTGWALRGFRDGWRLGGAFLLSVAGIDLFLVLTFLCMLCTPSLKELLTTASGSALFTHPLPGFVMIGVITLGGFLSLRKGRAPSA